MVVDPTVAGCIVAVLLWTVTGELTCKLPHSHDSVLLHNTGYDVMCCCTIGMQVKFGSQQVHMKTDLGWMDLNGWICICIWIVGRAVDLGWY